MLQDLIQYMVELLKKKDKRGLQMIFFLLVGGILFISPGFLYLFLYERQMMFNIRISIIIALILIGNTLLFVLIYLLIDALNVKFDADTNMPKYNRNIIIQILNTELIMFGISVMLIGVYAIPYFMSKEIKIRIAMGMIGGGISILAINYLRVHIKLKLESKKFDKGIQKLEKEIECLRNNKE